MGGGFFQFVLTLIVVVAIIGLAYEYLVHRTNRRDERRREDEASEKAEMMRRLDALEERVRVLERIVTDQSSTLRDRFSDL